MTKRTPASKRYGYRRTHDDATPALDEKKLKQLMNPSQKKSKAASDQLKAEKNSLQTENDRLKRKLAESETANESVQTENDRLKRKLAESETANEQKTKCIKML